MYSQNWLLLFLVCLLIYYGQCYGYGYGNLMTHNYKKGRLQVLLLWYYHNFYFLIFSVFVRRFVEFCWVSLLCSVWDVGERLCLVAGYSHITFHLRVMSQHVIDVSALSLCLLGLCRQPGPPRHSACKQPILTLHISKKPVISVSMFQILSKQFVLPTLPSGEGEKGPRGGRTVESRGVPQAREHGGNICHRVSYCNVDLIS